ncbi:hypothetical protein F5Y09DRAFT_339372 [Xylaria sp. FL1042]|nr:hypothetical protein F5Y09DRAFT_339372 [Xylaria sp. FL1042]
MLPTEEGNDIRDASSSSPNEGMPTRSPDPKREIGRAPTCPDIRSNVSLKGHMNNNSSDTVLESRSDVVSARLPVPSGYDRSLSPAEATKSASPYLLTPSRCTLSSGIKSGEDSDDDDAKEELYILKAAINDIWRTYLDLNDRHSDFLPLSGTERDRYRPIIEEKKARDDEKRRIGIAVLDAMKGMGILTRLVTHKSFKGDYLSLSSYLKQAPRHSRQRPKLRKASYKTQFGNLEASLTLHRDHWYLGHRPGDPMVRIGPHPIERGGLRPGYMFYVPELAGPSDGLEAETYKVSLEGIVPFSTDELYKRFTRFAFPAFIRMIIIAGRFDPQNKRRGPNGWIAIAERVHVFDFDTRHDAARTKCLSLLQQMWKRTYGEHKNNYPRFLRDQIALSMSSFREMGWLMNRLERERPTVHKHDWWKLCKDFLQVYSGRDSVSELAQEHVDITLAGETTKQLKEGDVDNMLIYYQSEGNKVELQNLDNTIGPGPKLSSVQLRDICNAVNKALAEQYTLAEAGSSSARRNPTTNKRPPTCEEKEEKVLNSRKRSKVNQEDNRKKPPPPLPLATAVGV